MCLLTAGDFLGWKMDSEGRGQGLTPTYRRFQEPCANVRLDALWSHGHLVCLKAYVLYFVLWQSYLYVLGINKALFSMFYIYSQPLY